MAWMKIAVDEVCHVTWTVHTNGRQRYLHAIGDGDDANRVTEELARMRFDKSRLRTPWLPILFPKRAMTHGRKARNCATAAAAAFRRGWMP